MAALEPCTPARDVNEPEAEGSFYRGESKSGTAYEDGHKKDTKNSNRVVTDHRENLSNWNLVMEKFARQTEQWPSSGQHILAQFDDQSVVVYQAFKPSIAEYAVKHQRFGGPEFSFDRMSWIKTNFMWMMYRCGWAKKANQERVLAVRITREGFENILSKALTGARQKALKIETKDVEVRLQWDPDHGPKEEKLVRRAIQLGLKGKVLLDYSSKYILNIKDITEFVHEQHTILYNAGQSAIMTPLEYVYMPSDSKICEQIGLDFCAQQTVISFGS